MSRANWRGEAGRIPFDNRGSAGASPSLSACVQLPWVRRPIVRVTSAGSCGYTAGSMSEASKILVVQPNWVGDAVMATPTLRAIRELYPSAHISYLMRRYVKQLYSGMPWADQIITHRTGKTHTKTGKSILDLSARLRRAKFDLAVLLPNSFKSALICKMAMIPRVVGY